MVEVTQVDIEAAEEIGSLMATYYEYNRRSCYDDALQIAAKFREAAFRAGEKSMRERAASEAVCGGVGEHSLERVVADAILRIPLTGDDDANP